MDIQKILLIVAALVPAVTLAGYVYKKDRKEKEPFGLLMTLLGLGVLICFPAIELEKWLDNLLDAVFVPLGTVQGNNVTLPTVLFNIYQACKAFIGVALVEEGLKWIALLLVTKNNKNFNSLFDGIIYAVFVSLGFAAFENVLYCLEYGWATAVSRAFLSVPGHAFFGVLMGINYSWWRVYIRADEYETQYQLKTKKHTPDKISPGKYLRYSLLLPIIAHGVYDFACFTNEFWSTGLLYATVIFLYVYCLGKVRAMSKADTDADLLAKLTFKKLYPEAIVGEGDVITIDEVSPVERPGDPTYTKPPATVPEGIRVYTYPSGDRYVGAMVDGLPDGQGTYYFAGGGKYTGSFAAGKMNGWGVYIAADGGRYEGEWRNNQRHGKGTYFWKDGRIAEGYWVDGALVQIIGKK